MKVSYFGEEVEVPNWARWIATDIDGSVYVYEDKPRLMTYRFLANGYCEMITTVDAEWALYYWSLSLKELLK